MKKKQLEIGDRLRRIRRQKGFSSHENFAIHIDMDPKNYYNIENGANFTMATLIRITNGLGVTLSELFKDL